MVRPLWFVCVTWRSMRSYVAASVSANGTPPLSFWVLVERTLPFGS